MRAGDVTAGGVLEGRGADDREPHVSGAADRGVAPRRQVGRGRRPLVTGGHRQRGLAQVHCTIRSMVMVW